MDLLALDFTDFAETNFVAKNLGEKHLGCMVTLLGSEYQANSKTTSGLVL